MPHNRRPTFANPYRGGGLYGDFFAGENSAWGKFRTTKILNAMVQCNDSRDRDPGIAIPGQTGTQDSKIVWKHLWDGMTHGSPTCICRF